MNRKVEDKGGRHKEKIREAVRPMTNKCNIFCNPNGIASDVACNIQLVNWSTAKLQEEYQGEGDTEMQDLLHGKLVLEKEASLDPLGKISTRARSATDGATKACAQEPESSSCRVYPSVGSW